MRHIEIRDLWLQKEVRKEKLKVVKVLGSENPADLMTKILNIGEVEERLKRMNLTMMRRDDGTRKRLTGRMDDNDNLYRDDDDGSGPWICALFQQEWISDIGEMSSQEGGVEIAEVRRCEESGKSRLLCQSRPIVVRGSVAAVAARNECRGGILG